MEFVVVSLAIDLGPQTDIPTKAVTSRSVDLRRGVLDRSDDKIHQNATSVSTKSSPSCAKPVQIASLGCSETGAKESGTIPMFAKS